MAELLSKLRGIGRDVEKTVFVCSGELPLTAEDSVQIFYEDVGGQTDSSHSTNSVSLPVKSDDPSIERIMAACTPATFGKGSQEVLDKTYRDAVAMDASKFATSFQLSDHPQVLSEIQSILVADHGNGLVRARAYKLNVYGQGGFFKAHRDTPRGDALMFGTLVVCLPSAFEGGDFVVRSDDGFEQRFDWGAKSSNAIQWCAFYSDCEHEVLPVASGHRVTLTYLLERVPVDSLTGAGAALTLSSMEKTLREALADPTFAPYGAKLGFGLKHAYVVGENGAVPMLKGADRALKATLDRLGLHYAFVPVYASDSYDAAKFKQAQDVGQQGRGSEYEDAMDDDYDGGMEVAEFELPGVEEPPPLNKEDPFYIGDGANSLLVGTWKSFHIRIDMAPDEEYTRNGLDYESLDLHSTREVLWIAPPVAFPMEKNGATYGNEPTMSSYYAAASFIAWVPSWSKRSQPVSEPTAKKAKKTKRDADE